MDHLRGLAVLAVLVIHACGYLVYLHGFSGVLAANLVAIYFSGFAVPLFLFVSGYVLSYRDGGLKGQDERGFLGRRLSSVAPQYLVFTAVYILFYHFFLGTGYTAGEIAEEFLTFSAAYHLWFFGLLIQLYILFPALDSAFRKEASGRLPEMLLFGSLIIQIAYNIFDLMHAGILAAFHTAYPAPLALLKLFPSNLFYFVLGMWALRRPDGLPGFRSRSPTPALLAAAAALSVGLASVLMVGFRDFGSIGAIPQYYWIPWAVIGPFLFWTMITLARRAARRLAAEPGALSRFVRLNGANAFGIYLVHVIWMTAAATYLGRLGVSPENWYFYPAVFALALAASLATVLVIGRIPGNRFVIGHRTPLDAGKEAPVHV
jgi:peptidoglycan/LPS O-acetylase OafA/YrhL